jgi:hypothetical protein
MAVKCPKCQTDNTSLSDHNKECVAELTQKGVTNAYFSKFLRNLGILNILVGYIMSRSDIFL